MIALTASPAKADQIRDLGAGAVVDVNDDDAMGEYAQALDVIVNTIPYKHDPNPYLPLMKPKGTIAVVGNFLGFDDLDTATMVFQHITMGGSLIGGIPDTQDVWDLCAEHGIRPRTELIRMDQINTAWKRMEGEDVRFRHMIDIASLGNDAEAANTAQSVDDPVRGAVVPA